MKQKFLEFINNIKSATADLQTRANQQIATLPPVEQHEAASMIIGFKNELNWMIRRVEDMSNSELLAKADEILAGIGNEIIAERKQAGEILDKATHESLLEASILNAKEAARAEARQEFIAEQEKITLLASRRAEVDALLGANHGIDIPDEKLGESYDAFLACLKGAVDSAKENNFTAESAPKCFRNIILAAMNGTEQVQSLLATLVEVRGANASENSNAPQQSPFVATKKPGDESEAKGFSFKKPF